ncbi:hypothetical protein GCM10011490_10150 [Pseudoclavibacter endophyticus]|uniref:DUF2249 domain-containing protein n=1 Tax=Pseudoclavibacter endophyticus TaxID=1778590 RepID=A0A6H9WF28_9MICO|nr:DUF2249 domain-containing protein [Pseudoclavibacter endophyticus]KAB1649539.1 DUF2249 domain-containing protein [Pseudoclavibacter endophyticus]GGA61795.1 hypothetical protein GCM10011490_10150 [Pseudoclavibacter endophyticus]
MLDDREVDVRAIPEAQRHALVLAAFDRLDIGQAILLTDDHEPRQLWEEFDRELPGSFTWNSLGETSAGAWQARIVRRTRRPLPRLVADTSALLGALDIDRGGSVWQLNPASRDLDANIIALPPGDTIATHDGPDLDVLILVLTGTGTVGTENGEIPLTPGALLWLPAGSQRRIEAGDDGLRYFSVHHRKPTLTISPLPPRTER